MSRESVIGGGSDRLAHVVSRDCRRRDRGIEFVRCCELVGGASVDGPEVQPEPGSQTDDLGIDKQGLSSGRQHELSSVGGSLP